MLFIYPYYTHGSSTKMHKTICCFYILLKTHKSNVSWNIFHASTCLFWHIFYACILCTSLVHKTYCAQHFPAFTVNFVPPQTMCWISTRMPTESCQSIHFYAYVHFCHVLYMHVFHAFILYAVYLCLVYYTHTCLHMHIICAWILCISPEH